MIPAAAELIAELGWGRVTTRAVAERAGVPHGAVSYHFRGKQELLIESCLAAFAQAVPFEEFAAQATLGDLVGLIGSEIEQGLHRDVVLGRLMFEAIREAERDEVLRERLGTMITAYRKVLVAVVRAEQERGAISATSRPRASRHWSRRSATDCSSMRCSTPTSTSPKRWKRCASCSLPSDARCLRCSATAGRGAVR